jgi:hypothetical protein
LLILQLRFPIPQIVALLLRWFLQFVVGFVVPMLLSIVVFVWPLSPSSYDVVFITVVVTNLVDVKTIIDVAYSLDSVGADI